MSLEKTKASFETKERAETNIATAFKKPHSGIKL